MRKRRIVISDGFLKERKCSLEESLRELLDQIEESDSNKERKKLMRGRFRVEGRIREISSIISCLAESHTVHTVDVL